MLSLQFLRPILHTCFVELLNEESYPLLSSSSLSFNKKKIRNSENPMFSSVNHLF